MFVVTLVSDSTSIIPHVVPPPLSTNRGLQIAVGEAQTEVLKRPSFFEHYDSLVFDSPTHAVMLLAYVVVVPCLVVVCLDCPVSRVCLPQQVVDWKLITSQSANYTSSLATWASLQNLNLYTDMSRYVSEVCAPAACLHLRIHIAAESICILTSAS